MLGTCTGYERDMLPRHIPLVKHSTHRRFKRFTGYVGKKNSPLPLEGSGVALSIVCLYSNDRAPIPKRSVAYTQIETAF